ncbi:TIGR03619 family F420-dependent LLM class oxidoreductase [Myxococcota bacterium]|nr:TIGR03619 family F420-dependent LLM class oxidoreductase [Myxococcota bacterium]
MQYWVNALMVEAEQLLPIAKAADDLGYTGLALADHSVMPAVVESAYPGGAMPFTDADDWPDPWVQIGAMAAVTRRLRFVTNVYVLPARPLLVTAKAVATAAAIAGDRVTLGIGVGWMSEEFFAMGEDFSTRGARTDQMLPLLRSLLRGEYVESHGESYDLPRLRLRPVPGNPPSIWVGGESDAALQRAAHHGDGWISGRDLRSAAAQLPTLARLRREAGRADEPFEIAASLHVAPGREDVDFALDHRVSHLKVQPWNWYGGDTNLLETRLAALERFAQEAPDFHST